jgi:Tol biopolymer transport system component/predicted Ser/Thr protein kinase
VQTGDTLGHYRIVEPLGRGGMGEVFVAEDTRLHRRVALKVLPPRVATDATYRERFEREARAIAALNHPNIVTIHSVEEVGGRLFITMELVDGKPLGELIPRDGLPLEKLLRIGIDVADAMAAAQQQGITHRDLKPANVVITGGGRAKVLDFGLAKLKDVEPAGDDVTRMASRELTGEGKIVGTVAYMSPEQAEGKPVDPRSDIFSLGVMLHEMATGDRPFKGDTNVSIISSIIKDTPRPITDSKPGLPADLSRIVRRCLAKDPARRYQTAADLKNELEDLEHDSSSGAAVAPRGAARSKVPVVAVVAAIAALAAAAAAVAWKMRAASPAAPASAFTIDRLTRLTSTGTAFIAALSPDGRYVVHAKHEAGGYGLWMRQTATTSDVRIVPPADVAIDGLKFSPDGNYVYYSAYGDTRGLARLYRVPVLGGAAVKLIDDIDSGVAFSPDQKRLAFMRGAPAEGVTDLMVADAEGANVRALARASSPDKFLNDQPAWSPDGATILVLAGSSRPGVPTIVYAVDVATGAARPIGEPWGNLRDVQWLPDGRSYLITGLDLSGLALAQIWRVTYPEGERSRVTNDLNGYASVTLSSDGRSLATVQTSTTASIHVVESPDKEPVLLLGGAGREDGSAGVAWLPDGRIVYSSTASGLAQIWIADRDGGNPRQLTARTPPAWSPSVSPDGAWVYFSSYATGFALFRVAPDGSGLTTLTSAGDARTPIVSPDGKTLYYTADLATSPRAARMSITPGSTSETISSAWFRAEAVSPDGTQLLGQTWEQSRQRGFLALMDVRDGSVRAVPGDAVRGAFMPDGSLLVVERTQGKEQAVIRPRRGGEAKPLGPATIDTIPAVAVSRDGRIAIVRSQSVRDVVLIKAK